MAKHQIDQEQKVLELIKDLQTGKISQTKDDLLVYGWPEVQEELTECQLSKVIYTKTGPRAKQIRQRLDNLDYQPEIVEIQSVEVSSRLDNDYGGLIGVRWY